MIDNTRPLRRRSNRSARSSSQAAHAPATAPPPRPRPRFSARASSLGAGGEVGELGLLFNPLVSAAGKLLVLIGKLRNPRAAAQCAGAARFDRRGRQPVRWQRAPRGRQQRVGAAARYVLCTALDEAVANTPWGAGRLEQAEPAGAVPQRDLGRRKGVPALPSSAGCAHAPPAARADLQRARARLRGCRYRVVDNGRAQLDTVRQRLADLIAKDRLPVEAEPRRTGAARARARSAARVAAAVGVRGRLRAAAGIGLARPAAHAQQPLRHHLCRGVQPARAQHPDRAARAGRGKTPCGWRALSSNSEVKQGLVTVTDGADRRPRGARCAAILRGSGSADPMPQSLPVSSCIGHALAEV